MAQDNQISQIHAQKKSGTGGRFGHLQKDAPAFGLEDRIPTLAPGEAGQYAAERAWGIITSTQDNLGSLLSTIHAGESLSSESNESVQYAAGEAARQILGNRGRHIRVLGASLAHRLVPTAEAWARGEEHDLEPALNHWADDVNRYEAGQIAVHNGTSWTADEAHNELTETLHAYDHLITSQEKRRDQKRTSEKNRAIYQKDIDGLRESRELTVAEIAAEPEVAWSRYYRVRGGTQTHADPSCEFIEGHDVALVLGQWGGHDKSEVSNWASNDVCPKCF